MQDLENTNTQAEAHTQQQQQQKKRLYVAPVSVGKASRGLRGDVGLGDSNGDVVSRHSADR